MRQLERQVSVLTGCFDRALKRYLSCGGGHVARRSFRSLVGAFRKLAITVAENDEGEDYLDEVEQRGRALIGALMWTSTKTGPRDDAVYASLLAEVEALGVRTRIEIADPAAEGTLILDLVAGELRLEPPAAPSSRWAVFREDAGGRRFFMSAFDSKNEALLTARRFETRVPGKTFVVEPLTELS